MLVAILALTLVSANASDDGFVELFDGKTLSGWTAVENAEAWAVMDDGSIRGKGERSHLFSPKTYKNVHIIATVKTEPNANSGLYFRTKKEAGWPTGYEAQVNNSSGDPKRTGSLYNFVAVTEKIVPDNEWFTYEVIAVGNEIEIKINGKTVTKYTDEKNTHTEGHLALQQHDPGSVVYYKQIKVKELD